MGEIISYTIFPVLHTFDNIVYSIDLIMTSLPVLKWNPNELAKRLGFAGGITTADRPYHFFQHCHSDYWEFVCVLEGVLKQLVNGVVRHDKPGTIMLIRAHDVHELFGSDGCVFINMMFHTRWLQHLDIMLETSALSTSLTRQNEIPWVRLPKSVFSGVVKDLRQLFPENSVEQMKMRFARLFVRLMTDHFCQDIITQDKHVKMHAWLRQVLGSIDENPDHVPTVEELVTMSNRSAEHVSRSFRRYLGMTPSMYLNRKRLQQACRLLTHTDLPLLDVCYSVGFENASYFFRWFKSIYGMTPRSYRLKHWQNGRQP